ncbi:MAG: bifunctional riboflavin kinase/FAD synthetase [Candidatus Omnitrophica bacterium]|nr:bifunctional riboflavin kinase/FAD synthetase [Candidatus Omnitrophota bacterium]
MKLIHFSEIKKIDKEIVLGIGKFDGVHSGHKKILSIVLAEAKKEGRVAGIITFRKFPVEFLLCSWKEKLSLLKETGIELCVWCDFDDISHLSPEKFLETLLEAGAKTIVVGYNFRFGKGRKGDVKLLRKQSKERDFSLIVVPSYKKNGEIVSASKIRKMIKNGDIEKANKLLGRYFSVSGKVVKGKGIGKKMGFPTANLALENNICIGQGVYAGWVEHKRKIYKSAIVIGKSPTFNNDVNKFEVFIIDYEGKKTLYNKKIRFFLYKKLRNQIKFQYLEVLKKQIEKDIREIKIMLQKIPAPEL